MAESPKPENKSYKWSKVLIQAFLCSRPRNSKSSSTGPLVPKAVEAGEAAWGSENFFRACLSCGELTHPRPSPFLGPTPSDWLMWVDEGRAVWGQLEGSWSSRAPVDLAEAVTRPHSGPASVAAHLLPSLPFHKRWSHGLPWRISLHTKFCPRVSFQEIQPMTAVGGCFPLTVSQWELRGPLERLNGCLLDLGNILDWDPSCQRKLRTTGRTAERGSRKETRKGTVQDGQWVALRWGQDKCLRKTEIKMA